MLDPDRHVVPALLGRVASAGVRGAVGVLDELGDLAVHAADDVVGARPVRVSRAREPVDRARVRAFGSLAPLCIIMRGSIEPLDRPLPPPLITRLARLSEVAVHSSD